MTTHFTQSGHRNRLNVHPLNSPSIGCTVSMCLTESVPSGLRVSRSNAIDEPRQLALAGRRKEGCYVKLRFSWQGVNKTVILVIRLVAALAALVSALNTYRH